MKTVAVVATTEEFINAKVLRTEGEGIVVPLTTLLGNDQVSLGCCKSGLLSAVVIVRLNSWDTEAHVVPWLVPLGEQHSNPKDSVTHLSEIKVYLCGPVRAFYSCPWVVHGRTVAEQIISRCKVVQGLESWACRRLCALDTQLPTPQVCLTSTTYTPTALRSQWSWAV